MHNLSNNWLFDTNVNVSILTLLSDLTIVTSSLLSEVNNSDCVLCKQTTAVLKNKLGSLITTCGHGY